VKIKRSVDIEDEVRIALKDYLTAYCRPLPADYVLPNILVTQVGGSDLNTIDTFEVVLDARAEAETEASETLRTAIGVLKAVAKAQTTAIRHVSVNTSGSWGADPVRPDLALCTARLSVVAHLETMEV
jgi:hypothetical protein